MKIPPAGKGPPAEVTVRTDDAVRAPQTPPKSTDAFELSTSAESAVVPSEQSRRAWFDAAWQCLRPTAAASDPPTLDQWLAKIDQVVENNPPATAAPLAFDDRLVAGMAESILNAGVTASPDQVADRLARELPVRAHLTASAVSSLLVNHRAELEGVLAERWSQRIEQGAEKLADLAHRFPHLSLEELRRASATPLECLDRAHQIVGSDAERRSTRVDSQGPEPNLLLAVRLAAAMLNAPERISLASLIEDFCITNDDVLKFWPGFDVDAARMLQAAYPIVPRWSAGVLGGDERKTEDCPSWNSVTTDLRDELARWCAIPLTLKSLNVQQAARHEGRFLAGRPELTVEIATGKSFASLRHHITALGASGSDMTAIWKPYSELPDGGADPIIPQLCARSLGIHSIEPNDFAELQSTTVTELRRAYQIAEAGAGVVNLHLVGVECWDDLAQLAQAHPAVSARVTSHTSSDGDQLPGRLDELDNVVVMRMDDSPAKLAYEPEMLATVFEQMLWKTRELPGLPNLRRLPFLVHGAGKTVGPAMVEAIHGFGIGAEKCGVTDPRADTDPALRLKIEAQHATLVPVERAAEQFAGGLVSVNATAGDVLTEEMLLQKADGPLVHFQVGSNVKDVELMRRLSFNEEIGGPECYQIGSFGRMECTRFVIRNPATGRRRDVYLLGNGMVLNHAFRDAGTTDETELIELLKIECIGQAEYHAKRGESGLHPLLSVSALPRDGEPPLFLFVLLNRGTTYVRWKDDAGSSIADHLNLPGDRNVMLESRAKEEAEDHAAGGEMVTPLAKDTPSAVIAKGASLSADNWDTMLTFFERAADAGDLELLIWDLDNTIFQPRGYVGSETQEWDSTTALMPRFVAEVAKERDVSAEELEGNPRLMEEAQRRARSLVLERRSIDEQRMVGGGFYDLFAGLNAQGLRRIDALRRKGVRMVAACARPPWLGERVTQILAGLGIDLADARIENPLFTLDELVLTGGAGKEKSEAIQAIVHETGTSPEATLLVDDRSKNTEAAQSAGVSTVLFQVSGANHVGESWQTYLNRAASAPSREDRLNLLINAFAVTDGPASETKVRRDAHELLETDDHRAFEEQTRSIKEIVTPPWVESVAVSPRAR